MSLTGSRLNLTVLWASVALAVGIFGSVSLLLNVWRINQATRVTPMAQPGAAATIGSVLSQAPMDDVFADLGLGVAAGNTVAGEVLDIRLVGTFFEYPEIGTNSVRHAVLAEVNGGRQEIVPEGGQFLAYGVLRIERDMVTVEKIQDRSRYILRLATPDSSVVKAGAGASPGTEAAFGVAVPMSFGGQIASNHWVMNRDSLLSYYQELRDNPDRLLKVFDTMKPLRDPDGKITGYTVGIEGEKGFFDSVGLREGDVVRKTNGRPMTNRRLAERFIAGFVKGENNAFVLEVEREGEVEKLTFQIR